MAAVHQQHLDGPGMADKSLNMSKQFQFTVLLSG